MRRVFFVLALLSGCAGGQRPAPAPRLVVAPPPAVAPPSDPGLAAASAALPRREPDDSVIVAVFEPIVPTGLRLHVPPAAVAAAVKGALAADQRLRVWPIADVVDRLGRRPATLAAHAASAAARDPQLLPDLWLLPRVEAEEGGAGTLVLKVEVTSAWDGASASGESRGLSPESLVPGPELRAAVERLLPGLPARGAAITLVSARRSARAEEERDAAEQRRREQVELEERAGIRPDDDALTRTRKLQDLLARERAQPAR